MRASTSHHVSSAPVELTTPSICDVWADNLEEAIAELRIMILQFPYISMDTEFPGVVARPLGVFTSQSDFLYQTLRCNVDLLKIIQLGITLSDADGKVPVGTHTWQFNFKFSLDDDTFAQDSIDLLSKSGIDFQEHQVRGIDTLDFGELLTNSGLVLVPEVTWISFHSGYDFGYLLKVLTCNPLPASESEFLRILNLFFPRFYDIKFLMKSCKTLKGGLQDVADDLGVLRVGMQHQAGSDSHLTCLTFFKLRQSYFGINFDEAKFMNKLYGIGVTGGSNPYSLNVDQSTTPFNDVSPNSNDTFVNNSAGAAHLCMKTFVK